VLSKPGIGLMGGSLTVVGWFGSACPGKDGGLLGLLGSFGFIGQ